MSFQFNFSGQPQAPAPGPVPTTPAPVAAPVAAPAPTQQFNPYAGASHAKATVRTPQIPDGKHQLVLIKWERANVQKGEFVFIHFRIVQSENPALIGTVCGTAQNMNPAHAGGKNIAFSALKEFVYPLVGCDIDNSQGVAHLDAQGALDHWLFEVETKGTINGMQACGAMLVNVHTTPGVSKAGKAYSRNNFRAVTPAQPTLLAAA